MPQTEGPEEFFKVLREVQQGKKRQEGEPAAEGEPAPVLSAAPGPPGTLCLSYLAALGGLVIVVLVVLLAYLIGRRHGWDAYEADLRRQAEKATEKATSATPGQPAPQAQAPEVVDGAVFTLLTLGKAAADRESVEKEAEYLNKYAPFKTLHLEAHAWRDRSGRYRLCARGFKAMDEAMRKQVRDQVRNLVSRHGQREYRGSDFLPQ